jgi:hypothetical protein
MAMSGRRGGIPGPESRTGLVRPAMTEAEFERQAGGIGAGAGSEAEGMDEADGGMPAGGSPRATVPMGGGSGGGSGANAAGSRRAARAKPAKPRRVQRMFAIEEDLDKKLWLYAIHLGKDRSDVVNDLLRPVVASMVLYDSRDRRGASRAAAGAETLAGGDAGPSEG